MVQPEKIEKNMKILLISYYYGKDASGNITYRVAKELIRQGQEVFVITSDSPIISDNVYQCRNFFPDLSVIWRIILRIYRLIWNIELKNYFWVRRAYKKALEIINSKGIDCVYCRTSPLEACEVGFRLKKKTGIKTLLHFTDPEPSEFTIKNKRILKHEINRYKNIVNTVDIISFGTLEMQRHQEQLFGDNFDKKAFVSPDVSRDYEMRCLEKEQDQLSKTVVYLGSFGNYRNPIPLFSAIDDLNNMGICVHLNIYSNRPRAITYTSDNITFKGIVTNIDIPLKSADVLVDIDAEFENNPYLSSKVKDYIPVNRPILVISNTGSPIYNLTVGRKSFILTNNNRDSIKQGLLQSFEYKYDMSLYSDRFDLIERFSPNNVVKEIIKKLNSVVE